MMVTKTMTRHGLLVVGLLFGVLAAGAAWAHGFSRERSAVVQIAPDHVELMLIHAEPPGPRTRLLRTKFDLDRDGRLSALEGALIGAELREVAFAGLSIIVDGEALEVGVPQVKVKTDGARGGGLTAAYYRRIARKAPVDEATQRTVELRLADTATVAIDVAVEADGGLVIRGGGDGEEARRTSGARRLGPGESVRVELSTK